jgi:hypothetical protein
VIYASIPPHAFTVQCLVKHRDSFTFTAHKYLIFWSSHANVLSACHYAPNNNTIENINCALTVNVFNNLCHVIAFVNLFAEMSVTLKGTMLKFLLKCNFFPILFFLLLMLCHYKFANSVTSCIRLISNGPIVI